MKVKSSNFYIAGIAFVVVGALLGWWMATTYPVADSEYLKKAMEYPSLYPLSEMKRHANYMLFFLVTSVHVFFGTVCCGFGATLSRREVVVSPTQPAD